MGSAKKMRGRGGKENGCYCHCGVLSITYRLFGSSVALTSEILTLDIACEMDDAGVEEDIGLTAELLSTAPGTADLATHRMVCVGAACVVLLPATSDCAVSGSGPS